MDEVLHKAGDAVQEAAANVVTRLRNNASVAAGRGRTTIGNEVVSGDIANTNATWLAQRLEALGVHVMVSAAVPDGATSIRIGSFI